MSGVVGAMGDGAVERLQYRVLLAADGDAALQVVGLKGVDGVEEELPVLLPPLQQLVARGVGRHEEFLIAIAVGLLAVGGEEVGESASAGCPPCASR